MTIDEAIRNNTALSDFEAFKEFFEHMGIKYEIPADNLIYLSGFEVNSSQLIVIKFYDDGKFQEFCPYPEEGLTELKDLREENINLKNEIERLRDCVDNCVHNGELDFAKLKASKRLLKSATNVLKMFIPCDDDYCSECIKQRQNCDYDDSFKWLHTDEALKLIGDEDI